MHKTQFDFINAEAKKRWVAFDFKFEKFNKKQAISILDIFCYCEKIVAFFCCF